MPRSCDEDSSSGVERLRIPRGRKLESAVVLAFVVPVILTSLRPRYEASEAPVVLTWAYRDVLKGAEAALSVVRRARELRTLLIKVPKGDSICNPHGEFLFKFWSDLNLVISRVL
ncbi:hypothetical protein CDL15_Pgr028294 [Punica granatum]|uniref:Uncharacterized protein n=1 Tax=Punica granatum TaxID=22663 RepID=A0A218WKJ7_PUNGR|nr:hypothetical protein CDL15_Pgr028294 [Punica granatum]